VATDPNVNAAGLGFNKLTFKAARIEGTGSSTTPDIEKD
jgi:hypothetical protein